MIGESSEPSPSPSRDEAIERPATVVPPPREIGGRPGPDPTRYGDWERSGRCIDF
jgi:hypothetical protein